MRGSDEKTGSLFSYVDLKEFALNNFYPADFA